jgi:hypothetical protein
MKTGTGSAHGSVPTGMIAKLSSTSGPSDANGTSISAVLDTSMSSTPSHVAWEARLRRWCGSPSPRHNLLADLPSRVTLRPSPPPPSPRRQVSLP